LTLTDTPTDIANLGDLFIAYLHTAQGFSSSQQSCPLEGIKEMNAMDNVDVGYPMADGLLQY
jgi:hypothetical protein